MITVKELRKILNELDEQHDDDKVVMVMQINGKPHTFMEQDLFLYRGEDPLHHEWLMQLTQPPER